MHVHFKFMLLSTAAAAAKEGTFKNTSSCHYLMLCIYRGQEVKRERERASFDDEFSCFSKCTAKL